MERARTDGSIVLSFDLDFGDILALGVMDKPSVILFRLADERAESVNSVSQQCWVSVLPSSNQAS